jgi:hypothetical protein
MRPGTVLLVAAVAPAPANPSSFVLNEVLYDPAGADGGAEFVEIIGDSSASLDGWVLETGNGARPGDWAVAWIGGAGDRLRGGLFLLGESAVQPRPDAVVDLDLQNGPDACRLRGPGGEIDVLGWGAPLADSYFEGSPAADVSGASLARLPDGFDTGDNARDFRASTPTPGDFNAPDSALAVEAFAAPPVDWPPGRAWAFEWSVRNVGRRPVRPRVHALCAVHPGEVLASAAGEVRLPPGEITAVRAAAVPPAGVHLPRSDPPAEGEAPAWQGVGPDVLFSEAMTRPARGGEWIELLVVADTPVDLASFHLEDAAGTSAPLERLLRPGERVRVTADPAAVREHWVVPPSVPIVKAAPWPSLNHTASAGAVAERVALRVGPVEAAAASFPGGAKEGVSWETITRHHDPDDPASWAHSLDGSGATPGLSNSRRADRPVPAAAMGSVLSVHPSPFRPGRDGTALVVLRPPAPASTCRVRIYDSSGLPVCELVPWAVGPREHRALWDGRHASGAAAALGLYLILGETQGSGPVRASLVLDR